MVLLTGSRIILRDSVQTNRTTDEAGQLIAAILPRESPQAALGRAVVGK